MSPKRDFNGFRLRQNKSLPLCFYGCITCVFWRIFVSQTSHFRAIILCFTVLCTFYVPRNQVYHDYFYSHEGRFDQIIKSISQSGSELKI